MASASDQQPSGPLPPPIEAESQPTDQQQAAEPESTSRPAPPRVLPDKDVSPDTIGEAYISFILYCNPALPQDCMVDTLREAFKAPPKSQGKEFPTWSVFQNVKRFYNKEIPTWTEMVVQLGVDPPDLSKDESSQKITQYGVRLKRWLQSYHLKPFFEYLMDIPNEYWTDIPTDPDPVATPVRDGVNVEDDMALRALLPHIRPKRGRKRPMDYEVSTPLSARPVAFPSPWQHQGGTPLSAHPGNASSGGQALLAPNDGSQTPLSRYPSSAVTPTTRNGFWDSPSTPRRGAKGVSSAWKVAGKDNGKTRGRPPMDRPTAEDTPSAAYAGWPSKPGSANPAWAYNPTPPSNKKQRNAVTETTTPTGATVSQSPASAELPTTASNAHVAPMAASQPTLDRTTSAPVPPARSWSQSDGSRPTRPSISLQVPQRQGGNVRLATPPPPTAPPAVMINGEHEGRPPPSREFAWNLPPGSQPPPPQPYERYQPQQQQQSHQVQHSWPPAHEQTPSQPYEHPSTQLPENAYYDSNRESANIHESGSPPPQDGLTNGADIEDFYFEKIPERTNVDTLLSFFMRATQDGQWFDHNGAPAESASMDEAAAITNCTLQAMLKTAASPQAFLINLGALAGARTLMTTRPKYFRMPDGEECHNYKFEWEYRFGHFKGHFNMTQTVPWRMFKKPTTPAGGEADREMEGEAGMSAEEWKGKYKALLGEMKKREQELSDLRGKVMSSLREDLR